MIKPFLLVVADRDQKVFSIHGPMSDDTQWINAVVAAQKMGREVNCFTAGESQSRTTVAADMKAQFAYAEVDAVELPNPSN